MKKHFDLPVVDLISFESEDIICTSGPGSFLGEQVDNLQDVLNGQKPEIPLPMDPL